MEFFWIIFIFVKKIFTMSEKLKVFTGVKRGQMGNYHILNQWCVDNGLTIQPNNEVFFITETVLMKPEFIINGKVYFDLIEGRKITNKYMGYCEKFSRSYGIIVVIPNEIVSSINTVTKKDFENKFNFKF
jgi:hypothetical protein